MKSLIAAIAITLALAVSAFAQNESQHCYVRDGYPAYPEVTSGADRQQSGDRYTKDRKTGRSYLTSGSRRTTRVHLLTARVVKRRSLKSTH
jgi:hypothetical protein